MLRGQRIALHPDDGQPITLESGKYGPYLKHGTTYASLRKVQWHCQRPPVCCHKKISGTGAQHLLCRWDGCASDRIDIWCSIPSI